MRRSLAASQQRVAALLRDLYIQGEPDPIAVILGATSLDEAVAGIEGLSRATAQNERLGVEAEQRARRLARLRADLAAQRERLDAARSEARRGAARLARGRRGATGDDRDAPPAPGADGAAARRPAGAGARGRAALGGASRRPRPGAAAAPPRRPRTQRRRPPRRRLPRLRPADTRSFVVDAVAYHLPGKTASGLPVGVGVIAVDPTVIPLGTRVFVPGYGPAVAADVGTAIKGNIIDLWMPSTAQALAWGRRTVTITIYG